MIRRMTFSLSMAFATAASGFSCAQAQSKLPAVPDPVIDGAMSSVTTAVHDAEGRLIGAGQIRQIGRNAVLTVDATILPPGPYTVSLARNGTCVAGEGKGTESEDVGKPHDPAAMTINPITTYGRTEQYLRDFDLPGYLKEGDLILIITPADPTDGQAARAGHACGKFTGDIKA